jgi:baculoviral IAP repeat-containing protein 7/8
VQQAPFCVVLAMFIDLKCGDKIIKNFVLRHSSPLYPSFVTESSRRNSFSTCPDVIRAKLGDFVESGFFYSPRNNVVVCFSCGIQLGSWENEDKVDVEHSRWQPNCTWVYLTKGRAFVDEVKKSQKDHLDKLKTFFDEDDDDFIDSPLNFAYYEKIGIPMNFIRGIYKNFFKREQRGFNSQQEMSDAIASTFAFKAPKIESQVEKVVVNIDPMCSICSAEDRCMIFVPCGHLLTCPKCSISINSCPFCRSPIEGFFKAYIV